MANRVPEKDKMLGINLLDRIKQDMVSEGLVTREKLRVAEVTAIRANEPLTNTLIQLGFVTEDQMVRFISGKFRIPHVDLRDYTIDRKVLGLVPERIAHRHKVIPLFMIENVLTVAMSHPLDIICLDEISSIAGCPVEAVIASEQSIDVAIDDWYGARGGGKELVDQLVEEFKETERHKARGYTKQTSESHLEKEAEDPPVIRLVDSFITHAIAQGATDIHLQPRKDSMVVRFRIDGFLHDQYELPTRMIPPITSRIKVMSGLDISNRRTPQDGRIGLRTRDMDIDIRTSTYPSMYGENVVLRILDKTQGTLALSKLGFSNEDLHVFKRLIQSTRGMILATGPTGSGKTTTVYSAINAMNRAEKNIMTIEDPIEYEIEGVVQSQVELKSGISFPNALRSILRQDPDVIYIGEIRDLETAEIAVRAALTGHLALSTLHTNHAVGSITRLRDIGVETELIGTVVNCSFSQRLVRRICPRCSKAYQPDESLLKTLGLPLNTKFYEGKGCDYCSGIGYRGRIGIFEVLVIDGDLRTLIAGKAPEKEIMEAARAQGMKTLREDGLIKVLKGITTLDEVKRVTEEI